MLNICIGLTGFVKLATAGAAGAEKHMTFECAALALLRQRHADLDTPSTDTMRSFFAQQDHLGFLNYVIELFRLHEDTTLLPWFGTNEQPVGWLQLVKYFTTVYWRGLDCNILRPRQSLHISLLRYTEARPSSTSLRYRSGRMYVATCM